MIFATANNIPKLLIKNIITNENPKNFKKFCLILRKTTLKPYFQKFAARKMRGFLINLMLIAENQRFKSFNGCFVAAISRKNF